MKKHVKSHILKTDITEIFKGVSGMLNFAVRMLVLSALLALPMSSNAQFTAVVSGDWNDGATWGNTSPGSVGVDYPGVTDNAFIPSTLTNIKVTVTGIEACNNLELGSTPSAVNGDTELEVSLGGQLTIAMDITMPSITESDTEYVLDVNDGIVIVDGDITCDGSTSSSKNTKDCRIFVGNGTLTITGDVVFNEIHSSRQYFDFTGDGIINFNGEITAHKDALKLNAAGNLSTVNFTGTGYDIPFDDFDNVDISGTGTYSNASGALFNVRSSFTISNSARFDMVDQNLEVAENFICTSSDPDPLIERALTVIFDGGSTSSLTHVEPLFGNTLTFYDIQVGGSANNRKIDMTDGSITANSLSFITTHRNLAFRIDGGDLTIATGLTIQNGSTNGSNIIRVNDGSLTVPSITMKAGSSDTADSKLQVRGGILIVTGDVVMEGDSNNNFVTTSGVSTTMQVGGSITGGQFENSATGTSALVMDGTGPHTLGGAGGFLGGSTYDLPSLVIDGSAVSLGEEIDVEGDVTITTGSIDVTANDYKISVDGDWSNAVGVPGFIPQNGTVSFDSGSTQSIQNKEDFHFLEVINSDTELTIAAGGQITCVDLNILDGADVIYEGAGLTTTNLNILSPNTSTSNLIINNDGVIITNLTISGRNSDLSQTAGNTSITGPTEIYCSDVTNENTIDISGGTITLTTLELFLSLTASANNNRDAIFILSGNGNADINGDIKMHASTARTYFDLQGSGDLRIAGHINGGDVKLNGGTGTTYFDGAAGQNIAGDAIGTLVDGDSYVFGNIQIENTSASSLQATIQCDDITFAANGTLDANTFNLNLRGDFTINGALTDPFDEDAGTVKFNGKAAHTVQTIDNLVGAGLTFRRVVIDNTSGLAVGVQTNDDITLTVYDHNEGVFSLLNNDITLNGAANQTSDLTVGSLITNGSASSFTYTDPALTHTLNFSGHDGTTQTFFIGDATNGIDITGNNVGDVMFEGADIYGDVSFTRNKSTSGNACSGGMIYRNNVQLTINAGSNRWRLADQYPDIYYGTLDIAHNGQNNFIIGRASLGNEYHGKVTLYSSTSGGLYVGRDNLSRSNSNTFFADFEAIVSSSGAIIVANGDSDSPSTVVFDGGDIIFRSTLSSTGNIEFGEDEDNFSQITLQNGAKFNTPSGNVLGTTEIRICNVDQTDASVTNNIELTLGARLALGYDATSSSGNMWSGDINFIAPRIISMVYNTFAGDNAFTKTGTFDDTGTTIGDNANGFNSFAIGSTTTFSNTSSARWRLGVYGGNDYNGDVNFVASAAGLISPCYNATSTFSGNISTVGSGSVITFAENTTGLMEIDGTGAMTFDGDDGFNPIVDKLLMDGVGADVDLEVDMIIPANGTATFTNGIISSDATDMFIFENQTASTNIGSQASFVEGPVKWSITSNAASYNLKFPIGDNGEWRAAELDIKHFSIGTAEYTGEMIGSSAIDLGYTFADASFINISDVRYWDLDKTGAATIETGSATLYYSTADNNDGAGDATNLNMVKTIGSGTVWNNIGGVGTADDTGSITSSVNFTTFSKFTLANKAGGANVLPIELIDFSATKEKDHVNLNWITATETNNDFFSIERSKDGASWERILTVDGAGNSTEILNYTHKDLDPLVGLSYYRLKQTDYDGQFSYSKLEAVNFEKEETAQGIIVYPNPLFRDTQELNITFETKINEDVFVQIMDLRGVIVYSKAVLVDNNISEISISTENALKAGTYVVMVSRAQGISTSSLIVN